VPPRYSAIKIDGQRAYDLARANEAVELAPRTVRIDAFELASMSGPDHAEFLVTCGKGAYMRSLARDLARALGTCGHIHELRRLSVGPFDESRAISLDSFAALGQVPAAFAHLLPIETALDDIPALALTGTEAVRLRSGQAVPLFRRGDLERLGDLADGDLLRAHAAGKLVAVVRFEQGRLCPVRVLNL
jgi:tRNA pseudouridine55 synthase